MVSQTHCRQRGSGSGQGKHATRKTFKGGLREARAAWPEVSADDLSRTSIGPPLPESQYASTDSQEWSSSSAPNSSGARSALPQTFQTEFPRRQHSWKKTKLQGAVQCFLKKLCSAKLAPLEDVAWKCKRCGKMVCVKCVRCQDACGK